MLARVKGKITQTQLAANIGIPQSHLSMIEHDKITPNIFTAICIADALQVSLDELVGRSSR
jgi:DNA-binding XRE family transcriptional regulator